MLQSGDWLRPLSHQRNDVHRASIAPQFHYNPRPVTACGPDGITLANDRTYLHAQPVQMGEQRRPAIAMVNDHDPSVATIFPRKGDTASGRRHNLRDRKSTRLNYSH